MGGYRLAPPWAGATLVGSFTGGSLIDKFGRTSRVRPSSHTSHFFLWIEMS
jgi:hypothetical protein